MPDPIFGVLRIDNLADKFHDYTRPKPVDRLANAKSYLNAESQSFPSDKIIPAGHARENPLGTVSSVPLWSTNHSSPKQGTQLDLLTAHQELQSAHEQILRLEAEIRKARLR
jgi:hypothetical protein